MAAATARGEMTDYLNDYAHLREATLNVGTALASVQPSIPDLEGKGLKLHIEGKLGRLKPSSPPPAPLKARGEGGVRFDSDVGSAAFCAILQMLESFPRWSHVSNWEEVQEVYFAAALPRDALDGLEDESRSVEVRSTVRTLSGLTVSHTVKKRIERIDLAIQNVDAGACAIGTCSQSGASFPLDARITISLEKLVPDGALPLAVHPRKVRIRQSKSFFLASLGVARDCYSFELSVNFEGKTKTEAEGRQRQSEGGTYEVVITCLAPKEYLETSGDPMSLALSVILKLLDFPIALNPNSSVSFAPTRA
jgi:hypothetical protein